MPDKPDDSSKIFIDSDWKEEARREKEEADRQTREAGEARQIPEPSLLELIQMIVLQASVGLGGMQDPQTGRRIPANLPVAKHYIDLLGLLHQKTANNLDEMEKNVLEGTLYELQMAFVQMVNGGTPEGEPETPEA